VHFCFLLAACKTLASRGAGSWVYRDFHDIHQGQAGATGGTFGMFSSPMTGEEFLKKINA